MAYLPRWLLLDGLLLFIGSGTILALGFDDEHFDWLDMVVLFILVEMRVFYLLLGALFEMDDSGLDPIHSIV